MHLKFSRKLSKAADNKSTSVTVPKCVAESWANFKTVDMVFDGSCLVLVPASD